MTKVAYNNCFGGFSLSDEAYARYRELGGTVEYDGDIPRDDPFLIRVIEEMGEAADGPVARLEIRDVPKGGLWRIDEYDGNERVVLQSEYEWKSDRCDGTV